MTREEIERLVAEWVNEIVKPPVELVEVEYVKEGKDWILRVYLDKQPEGIDVEDCREVSLALSDKLDEADPIPGAYSLEVSSPGLERALTKPADYKRFAGRNIEVRTYSPVAGKKKIQGTLLGLEEGQVVLQTEVDTVSVPLDKVAKAKLTVEF